MKPSSPGQGTVRVGQVVSLAVRVVRCGRGLFGQPQEEVDKRAPFLFVEDREVLVLGLRVRRDRQTSATLRPSLVRNVRTIRRWFGSGLRSINPLRSSAVMASWAACGVTISRRASSAPDGPGSSTSSLSAPSWVGVMS